MARPHKPEHELRKRWDALHVTPAERTEVTAAALAAGQSVSQYLLSAHRGISRRGSHQTAVLTQALVMAEHHLALLSQEIPAQLSPLDAVALQARLLAIERSFRQVALPWSLSLDTAAEAADPC